jgi:exopolysaccharide biosynthesis polyprenyl glycosylphosphotransferase
VPGRAESLINEPHLLADLQPDAVVTVAPPQAVRIGSARRAVSAVFGDRRVRIRRALVAADLTAVGVALLACVALSELQPAGATVGAGLWLALGLPLWTLLAQLNGLYRVHDWRPDHGTADELGPLTLVTTLWAWGLLAGGWVAGVRAVETGDLLILLPAAVLALAACRTVVRAWARRRPWYWQNALVIGHVAEAERFVNRLLRRPQFGIHVVAVVDSTRRTRFVPDEQRYVGTVPVLDGDPPIEDLIRSCDVDRVVVVGSHETSYERDVVCRLADLGVHVDLVPTWTEAYGGRLDVHSVGGLPVLTAPRTDLPQASRAVKRTLDVVLSAAALVVLSPVVLVCALAIRLDSRGPVFFRQRRVGKDHEPFEVVKFRSMYVDADERKQEVALLNFHGGGTDVGMFKIRHDPRITRVGALLRRSSLDELPQLINVLRGDMSLVGPRPLIENEHRQISEAHLRRASIKPGLTGPWQVNGRSDVPFEEMIALDASYVMSWSLGGDIKLILRTFGAVARRQGAY